MKMKKILLSFSLIMILCLFLGINTQAVDAKSITNKPKDIKSIKVDKSANARNGKGLKDITLEEFFKKVNNKKEEELIKKIVVGSEPESILILKEKDVEVYTLMVCKNVGTPDMFSNINIFFKYDFTEDNSNKSLILGNYFELLDSLDETNSKVLFKNVVDYIDNKELNSQIVPYSINCYNVISNNANALVVDRTLKNNKEYYSESQITTDNNGYIGVNLHTTMGKIEYYIIAMKF